MHKYEQLDRKKISAGILVDVTMRITDCAKFPLKNVNVL